MLGAGAFEENALSNNVAIAQREAAFSPELTGSVAAVESWNLTTPEVGIWRMKKDAVCGSGEVAAIKHAEEQWP